MNARSDSNLPFDYVVRSHELAAEPVAVPLHGAAGGVAARLRRLPGAIRRWLQVRATVRELSMLDDHLLADIGISRGQILDVARSAGRRPVVRLSAAPAPVAGVDDSKAPSAGIDRQAA